MTIPLVYFWGKYPASAHRLGQIQQKETTIFDRKLSFFYPSRRLGISSAVRRYITKNGKAVFVSHHAIGVYKIFLRLDDIQPLQADDIHDFVVMRYKASP